MESTSRLKNLGKGKIPVFGLAITIKIRLHLVIRKWQGDNAGMQTSGMGDWGVMRKKPIEKVACRIS